MANPAELTITQAAAMLGVSTRTIRRRIKAGEVSARKQLRGKQEVWTIDGAELARYAQASGQPLTPAAGDPGQRVANAEAVNMTEGGVSAASAGQTAAEVDSLRWALAAVTEERDYLRRILENVTKALPAHKEEPKSEPPAPQEEQPKPPGLLQRAWARLTGREQNGAR